MPTGISNGQILRSVPKALLIMREVETQTQPNKVVELVDNRISQINTRDTSTGRKVWNFSTSPGNQILIGVALILLVALCVVCPWVAAIGFVIIILALIQMAATPGPVFSPKTWFYEPMNSEKEFRVINIRKI